MFGMLATSRAPSLSIRVLDDASLKVRRGEKVAAIGRNGAGRKHLSSW
jgi:ABC-type polysaccharide/polyol phosphate transport system ATPase subunit